MAPDFQVFVFSINILGRGLGIRQIVGTQHYHADFFAFRQLVRLCMKLVRVGCKALLTLEVSHYVPYAGARWGT